MTTLYEVMDGIFDSAQRDYFSQNFGSLTGIMQYADGALDYPITTEQAERIKAAGEHYLKRIEDGGFHHEAWKEAREMLED